MTTTAPAPAPEAPAPAAPEPTPAAEAPAAVMQRSLGDLADLIGLEVEDSVELGLPSCIAIIADAGAGKTTLAGGIIKVPLFRNAKIAYIDVEKGTSVWAQDPQIMHAVQSGQITRFSIDKTDPIKAKGQLDKLLGYKDDNGQKHVGALFSPAFGVDVIIIDTFDTLQEIGKDFFMATTRTQDGRQDTQGAYGKLAPWTTDILWELQHGKPFGLVLSHGMEKKDKKTGIDKLSMKLAGSAKESVASIPDLVAYMTWQEKEDEEPRQTHLVAHMSQSAEVTVKNRYGFDGPMWDFSLPVLFAAIDQKIAASQGVIDAFTQANTPAVA
ncbi:AAA family ATPase [Leifsonia aquatica]|uniref:AAA family ATPase n=1 Tax=Leifsonia aquatica TaxID=144185 RepID=UPI000468C467|nr:AAA family ATPase [Leifsonia aquatica]